MIGDTSFLDFKTDTDDPEQLQLMAEYIAAESLKFRRGNGNWTASFRCAGSKSTKPITRASWAVRGLKTEITEFKVIEGRRCP